jgi:MFS transporter, ACS family, pantothenate transporter
MGKVEEGVSPYSLDAEAELTGSKDQLVVKPIGSWKGYVWDTWELPKDERWLLFKVDAFVLTFASVSVILLSRRKENEDSKT